jgi:hypothetical protein
MSQSDQQYLDSLKKRYLQATRKERGRILDEFVETTGYHRKYAIAILTQKRKRAKRPIRRPRRTLYTGEAAYALGQLSGWFDGINSKSLRVAMDNELAHLYEHGDLPVSAECYERLKQISPATMDRLRAKWGPPRTGRTSRGRTKPGTLLKSQMAVRTWADWNEDRPGFTEMDWVAPDGGNPRGEHAWTLNFTDLKTGWTECAAVRNKAQIQVFEALRRVRARLPFPWLGVDSDNGSEFINDELVRYCDQEQLTLTRSRSGHKNDSAQVEQKNYAVVRRFVGDRRFDTPAQLKLLNQWYELLHCFINFFLPTTQVKEKIRQGSQVKRVYDEPPTPYARALASPHVSRKAKAKLRAEYQQLNVAHLKRQIDDIVTPLWDDATRS